MVATNVVSGSINALFHYNLWNWNENYLFYNKLRGALSNSNEESNTKSFELQVIIAIQKNTISLKFKNRKVFYNNLIKRHISMYARSVVAGFIIIKEWLTHNEYVATVVVMKTLSRNSHTYLAGIWLRSRRQLIWFKAAIALWCCDGPKVFGRLPHIFWIRDIALCACPAFKWIVWNFSKNTDYGFADRNCFFNCLFPFEEFSIYTHVFTSIFKTLRLSKWICHTTKKYPWS